MTSTNLNILLLTFFKELEKDLNRKTIQVPKRTGNLLDYPILKIDHKPTLVHHRCDAFNLNKSEIIYESNTTKISDLYVDRVELTISNNLSDIEIKTKIQLIIVSMLKNLSNYKGFDENTWNVGVAYASFFRPGQGDVIFRDCQQQGLVELRLFSDCLRYEE